MVAGREANAPTAHLRALHAWRGVAAIVVAASHFNTTGYIGGGQVAANAERLVDFFFVLSGFVIAYAYRDRLQRGEIAYFLVRRIGRLWPLHIATLAIIVLMALAGRQIGFTVHGWTWSSLPATVTLTHSWGFLDRNVWNGPSWSISTEMFAYLLFAFLAWRTPARLLDSVCAAAILVSIWILVAFSPEGMRSTHDFGLARCVLGFMTGVLGHSMWSAGLRLKGEIAAVIVTSVAVVFLPLSLDALTVPLFLWLVLAFAEDSGPVSGLLSRPFPQMLGTVSYSIYMIHYPINVALMTALLMFTNWTAEVAGLTTVIAPWWIADPLSILFLLATVAASQLTYAWIERVGRTFFNSRTEPVPAAW